MKTMTDIEMLKKLRACELAVRAVKELHGGSLARARLENKNVSWALWLLDHIGASRQRLRLLACRFVRETPLGDGRKVWDLLVDERSRKAVEVSEKYASSEATETAVEAAEAAARAAIMETELNVMDATAWSAAWSAAWDAARAAAWDAAREAQIKMIHEEFSEDEVAEMIQRKKEELLK